MINSITGLLTKKETTEEFNTTLDYIGEVFLNSSAPYYLEIPVTKLKKVLLLGWNPDDTTVNTNLIWYIRTPECPDIKGFNCAFTDCIRHYQPYLPEYIFNNKRFIYLDGRRFESSLERVTYYKKCREYLQSLTIWDYCEQLKST